MASKFYIFCDNSLGNRCKRGYTKCQPKKCRFFWQVKKEEKWKLDKKHTGIR